MTKPNEPKTLWTHHQRCHFQSPTIHNIPQATIWSDVSCCLSGGILPSSCSTSWGGRFPWNFTESYSSRVASSSQTLLISGLLLRLFQLLFPLVCLPFFQTGWGWGWTLWPPLTSAKLLAHLAGTLQPAHCNPDNLTSFEFPKLKDQGFPVGGEFFITSDQCSIDDPQNLTVTRKTGFPHKSESLSKKFGISWNFGHIFGIIYCHHGAVDV